MTAKIDNKKVPRISFFEGAFRLLEYKGQSSTQGLNKFPNFKNSMRKGSCPKEVAADWESHSTWIRPPKV